MRRLARAVIEMAEAVKHGRATRTKAGVAADAGILLANLLRRIDETRDSSLGRRAGFSALLHPGDEVFRGPDLHAEALARGPE